MILTGPVGGGKSTLTRHLARALRQAGISTAAIDLDQVYCMARQQPEFGDQRTWATARRVSAIMGDVFFASGLQAVIVEGGFLTAFEYAQLREHLQTPVQEFYFTLMVSAPNALHRAQTDPNPDRVASRLPDIQAVLYAEFAEALPYLHQTSQIIEADSRSSEALAQHLLEIITAKNLEP